MKRYYLSMALVGLVGGIFIAGCQASPKSTVLVTPSGQIVVPDKPPPPRHAFVGATPADSYVWVDGFWTDADGRWVRIPGHWATPGSTGPASVGGP